MTASHLGDPSALTYVRCSLKLVLKAVMVNRLSDDQGDTDSDFDESSVLP